MVMKLKCKQCCEASTPVERLLRALFAPNLALRFMQLQAPPIGLATAIVLGGLRSPLVKASVRHPCL
eukprot:6457465-Amphidinium_carterae.1